NCDNIGDAAGSLLHPVGGMCLSGECCNLPLRAEPLRQIFSYNQSILFILEKKKSQVKLSLIKKEAALGNTIIRMKLE
ncbi:hypothetical protein Bpfe_028956, partial [Biomphalaria pfeifferi]